MNEESGTQKERRLQPKTIWLAVWFVFFGGVALGLFEFYLSPEEEKGDDSKVSSPVGPLPIVVAPDREPDIESETLRELGVANVDFEKLSPPHQPIEDPGGSALGFFNRSLDQLSRGERISSVRIIHYGDSILTTDQLSGQIRRVLQKSFGDGGHGFVLMGKPWRWYHHVDVDHGAKGKWRPRPFTSDPLRDGLYGLGGVAFEALPGSHGRAWAGTSDEGEVGGTVEFFDLSYLEQPDGGSFELKSNDRQVNTVSTKAEAKRVVHREIHVPRGAGKIEIEYNNDGPLRLFGVTLESGSPGIVYDSLAINGARASALGSFDKEHWISELKRRDPALIILMLGANEGANRFLVLREYRVHLAEILQTLKEGLPETSILVIGPLDQAKRNPDGTFESKKMPAKLSKAQHHVALENGCAYFDTWTAMGGKGSMGSWFRRGLGGGDFIHPTEHGARKIGNWVVESLLYEYQRFVHEQR